MEIANKVRGYAFIYNTLRNQQTDPFCSSCNSFGTVLAAAREGIAGSIAGDSAAIGSLPPSLARLLADARDGLAVLSAPAQPVGQKKAGNCRLPEGSCFLKSSLALVQKI